MNAPRSLTSQLTLAPSAVGLTVRTRMLPSSSTRIADYHHSPSIGVAGHRPVVRIQLDVPLDVLRQLVAPFLELGMVAVLVEEMLGEPIAGRVIRRSPARSCRPSQISPRHPESMFAQPSA